MRVFRHLADVAPEFQGAVVAIGNFDGVHLGHRALIRHAQQHAHALNVPCAVLCFEPSSREFFRPGSEPVRLTPFRGKAHRLAALGVDAMFALPFDAEMARQSAQEFVLGTLVEGLKAACVVVGADFRFGHGRAGDSSVLAYMGEMEGFSVDVLPTIMAGGEDKISSTLIRSLIKAGKPEAAARLLGRPFAIEGRVEHGDKRGRTLGFPTANMQLDGYIRPAFGIYAVRVGVYEEDQEVARYNGVANLGIRPMYKTEEPLLETFLFDFSGDLYGKHLSVELISYLRAEAKFASVDDLVAQMTRDKEQARAILG
ncbi:riboflavin kinase/FMN adenylyltransferase [Rhizomicrobium palustre]|uniref:Riboflavin biosynthesis protein n=1 Tax=Rhizomicrobium palustre TaxID=189966 RepID=A0A846N0Q5_9PROT|nr:bifunctional riboflavin kinase/FAD synthetase [Rhizomicrobium palustre]NIK89065.1 riboflavin kinase/FMN adenylyltransferase [Rhizomicrobium palustre]